MKVREVSPLRQKTVDVMTLKGLSQSTQKNYLREIAKFDCHTGHQLEVQTEDAIRAWVLKRIDSGLQPCTTNVAVTALRLFYDSVLGQPEKVESLRCRKAPDRLPRTMPEEDVEHLIQAMSDVRYRTASLVAYGSALRISEVVSLQITDIRREEGLLHIRKGKGNHERMAYLPDAVLAELERYWKTTWPRPQSWLFYRRTPDEPITVKGLQAAFRKARDQADLDRGITFHCLRHAAATHLLERGASQSVVQDVLGHKSPETTRVYARTTGMMFRKLDHPVERFLAA